jgi:hypothetical protein
VATGSEVADDRLSLADTELLREAFLARLRSGRDVFRVEDAPSLDDVLGSLGAARQRAGDLPVVLLHQFDGTIGAIRVSLMATLASPEHLLELLDGDVFLATEHADDGLALQATTRHLSKAADRREFSFAAWGRFAMELRAQSS